MRLKSEPKSSLGKTQQLHRSKQWAKHSTSHLRSLLEHWPLFPELTLYEFLSIGSRKLGFAGAVPETRLE